METKGKAAKNTKSGAAKKGAVKNSASTKNVAKTKTPTAKAGAKKGKK